MQIANLYINMHYPSLHKPARHTASSPLATLSRDTVSFGAMKKSQFKALDYAVIEKFRAPIEKFNTNDDLQYWAQEKACQIAEKDFGGRQIVTKVQRKAMLKEWSDYVLKENDAYNSAAALLILTAITKHIKPCNDKLPPVLNKGVLADCISEIDKNIKTNKKYQFDLNKMYETKLRALYLEDIKVENGNTGWVVIPSKINAPEHFKKNVEKLKTLSHKNWCTKSFNAEPYLSGGDFHVYLENGQPKLGVRFVGDAIQEIQGELNNGKIPIGYFDEVNRHIDENKLKLTSAAKEEIVSAQNIKAEIKKIKNKLNECIKNKDAKAIFEYFKIDVAEDKDGFLTISEYRQPSEGLTFFDLGIDEDMLFEKVKKIENHADFRSSKVTGLGDLESIGRDADFTNSRVTDLSNLKSIGGRADFTNSQVTDLSNLKSIGGRADFTNSRVTDLSNLESIGDDACFTNSQEINLSNLEQIRGNANFTNSNIVSLPKLITVWGHANFQNSKITDIPNLERIGGNAFFQKSQLNKENKLQFVRLKIYVKEYTGAIDDVRELNEKLAEGYFD